VAHAAKNTSSLLTVAFPPARYVDLWGVFALSGYQAFSFPLYFLFQENIEAFPPEKPAGWQASGIEGRP